MWKRVVGHRTLTFHLSGINNQNFLMRDEQTGSWWQQVTGRAIAGPLRGAQLELVSSEDITLGLWRSEHPDGMVLLGAPQEKDNYVKADWEKEIDKLPTVVAVPTGGLKARDVIYGIEIGGISRAYPRSLIQKRWPLQNRLNGVPLAFVVGPDHQSIRLFRTEINGQPIDLFRATGSDWKLIDPEGDTWNFAGCATAGPHTGACLPRIPYLVDFWFDWHHYHPAGDVYRER